MPRSSRQACRCRSGLVRPAFLVAAGTVALGCGGGGEERAFIERLGTDTTAVEVFTRWDDRIEGDLLVRAPVTRVAHYVGALTPQGTLGRLEVAWRTPEENPKGPPPERITIEIAGDSTTVEREGGENPGTTRVAASTEAIPTVRGAPLAVAILEQAVRQAVASGADSFPVSFIHAGRPEPVSNYVLRHGADSVVTNYFGNPVMSRVDPEGRVLGVSGERTTVKIRIQPAGNVDFAALAADFAARDARGEGLGIPSPRGSVTASVGGANLEVDYGRPSRRGREIFGGLVPWNEVWRTGANAATHFTTDRNLVIGGKRIPAGTYTLWSTHAPDGAELIINSQTQIWGTAYDATHDFARVPMSHEALEEPVERFTIDIKPTGTGGVLHLEWDSSRYSVPMRVR